MLATSTSERMRDLAQTLRPQIDGELRVDAMTNALYATDASLYEMQPLGLLLPKTAADVQAALEACAQHQIPVLPRGGGSSLSGQTVAEALVIDCSRHLDAILEINAEEQWVRVQPGITLERLNNALAPHGLMVGPDPASGSRATLGGMVANNSTGTHSILYGNIIDHVEALEVLLADGTAATFQPLTRAKWKAQANQPGLVGDVFFGLHQLLKEHAEVIRRDTPDHWRLNSGYRLERLLPNGEAPETATRNPAQLLCGSEGTLAFTTEITLRVVPRPTQTALAIVHYETRDEALRSVTTILDTDPSAVELFDGTAIERTRQAPGFAPRLTFVEGTPGAVLITEYYGETKAELNGQLDALQQALQAAGEGYAIVTTQDPAQIDNVWTVRKEGLGIVMGVKGDFKPVAVIEDASVPVEHLADYIADLDAMLQAQDTEAVYYAHASAGCLHVRPFVNTKSTDGARKLEAISQGSMELVATYGGAIASEHGDGIVRGWLNEQFLGTELCDVYRRLKHLFDPQGILNPGKIIDTPAASEHLRMGPEYDTIPMLEELDWSADGGFARSVELCNGNGACRKLESGTMCPSFMVTREEEHSTRGRANALRAALSGALPREELTGERMHEVMDLCIQCKACKTECPSNVDMAKMKTEWLSKVWKTKRPPLRTRLFAEQPHLARWVAGTPLASVVNAVNKLKPLRWLMDRTLGISKRRDLPSFARRTFTQDFAARNGEAGAHANGTSPDRQVVFFADTFNNCHRPGTAGAAASFLEEAGYEVIVPEASLCCGRTYISKGFITKAQQQALTMVDHLHDYVRRGLPIVGLEPSCILTLADEFTSLLPGDLRAKELAGAAQTFETFIASEADAGRLDHLTWKDEQRTVLLHGHCHQKALDGTGPSERTLGLPPGYTVQTLDTSCCGMAGAFGYESEHVDISLKMAERRLAPAVREAGPDVLIAASGFSCRSQIKDATDRAALHPAEILLDALADGGGRRSAAAGEATP